MHCTHCGIELGADAKFCSSCGGSLEGTVSVPVKTRDWDLHVSILGWLIIAQAALTGLFGLIVMFAGQFVQKLMTESPLLFEHANHNGVPPPEVVNIIAPLTFLIGLALMVFSLPSVAAGIGLLRYRGWGRVLTLVLSFLRLLEFPLGTLTAIYSFWVLLSQGGKSFFKERAARAEV